MMQNVYYDKSLRGINCREDGMCRRHSAMVALEAALTQTRTLVLASYIAMAKS
jgi:hypothetical protein